MVRLKFVENVKEAVTFIEQGRKTAASANKTRLIVRLNEQNLPTHPPQSIDIRVGPDVIKDPASLVTRSFRNCSHSQTT